MKHKEVKDENPILAWFHSDSTLCDIVNAITAKNLSIEESARQAFYEVADYLKIPKYPDDISESMYREFDELEIEPESVFCRCRCSLKRGRCRCYHLQLVRGLYVPALKQGTPAKG